MVHLYSRKKIKTAKYVGVTGGHHAWNVGQTLDRNQTVSDKHGTSMLNEYKTEQNNSLSSIKWIGCFVHTEVFL